MIQQSSISIVIRICSWVTQSIELADGHDVQYYWLLAAGHKMHTAMPAVHASMTLRTLSYSSEWLANISRMIASGWILGLATPPNCLRIVSIWLDWSWYA
jgi:pheromone shutdown protein TraB